VPVPGSGNQIVSMTHAADNAAMIAAAIDNQAAVGQVRAAPFGVTLSRRAPLRHLPPPSTQIFKCVTLTLATACAFSLLPHTHNQLPTLSPSPLSFLPPQLFNSYPPTLLDTDLPPSSPPHPDIQLRHLGRDHLQRPRPAVRACGGRGGQDLALRPGAGRRRSHQGEGATQSAP
jgi:hypothetical protein